MSLAADALQPQLVRRLISLSGRPPVQHLADVITLAPGAGYDLDFDATKNSIRIDFRETSYVAAAMGGDACRFATACFTTLNLIAPAIEDPRTMAWGMVRLYYAAFYGGHSTLRLLGRSCSFVESRHISRVRALANAFENPPPFEMTAGLYHCVLNPGQTGFSMVQARGRVGGAHETFWEIFDTFLSEATEDVLLGHLTPEEARSVFAKLEAVRRIFRRGSGASWLSAVRNDIQYRQGRGVWPTTSMNRTVRSTLSRLSAQWTRDPMDVDIETPPGGDLGAFVAACAFTASLCRAILSRVADRSSEGARSIARAPLQLC